MIGPKSDFLTNGKDTFFKSYFLVVIVVVVLDCFPDKSLNVHRYSPETVDVPFKVQSKAIAFFRGSLVKKEARRQAGVHGDSGMADIIWA